MKYTFILNYCISCIQTAKFKIEIETELRGHVATNNQGKPQEEMGEEWGNTPMKRLRILIVLFRIDLPSKYLNASHHHEFQDRTAK